MCVLSVSLAATIKTKSNEGSNPRVEITTGDAHRELAMGYLNSGLKYAATTIREILLAFIMII